MHPDERALTAAVAAEPDDDLPRLVLADWLEEHDDPARAEFVRAQCRLAAADPLDPFAVTCRHVRPDWGTGEPWRPTLPLVPGPALEWLPDRAFRRGFGWALVVRDLPALLAHAPRLFAEAPVGELHLPTAHRSDWAKFAAADWLPRVRAVHFFGTVTPIEPFQFLCESPRATGLERVSFGWAGSPAMPELLETLFRSPLGVRVRELVFRSANVDGYFLDALATAPAAAVLESVRFEIARLDPGRAADFAALPLLFRLVALAFETTPMTPDWARAVAAAPGLSGLERLTVRRADLTPFVAAALADAWRLRDLRALDLGRNRSGGRALARELAAAGALSGLESLTLDECGLNAVSARQLAPHVGRLVELDVRGNYFPDPSAELVCDSVSADRVAALVLAGNRLGPAADHLRRRLGDRVVLDDPAAD